MTPCGATGRRKGSGGTTNAAAQRIIDGRAAEITAGLTDPYEKTRAVYDWVCANVAYAYSGAYSSDPVTVLEQRRAVCAGYGTMVGHAWAAAFVDGRWLLLDPTWGSSSTFENGQFTWKGADPHWFNRSIHLLSRTHRAETVYWDLPYDDRGAAVAPASASAARMTVDGKPVSVGAYVVNGNNYFKLRDVAAIFDFGVDWDGGTQTIIIDTARGYAG